MADQAKNQVTVRKLLLLAAEAIQLHLRPLIMMGLLAGVISTMLSGPIFHQLPDTLINMGTSTEADLEKAIKEAAPYFWPLIGSQLLILLAQSALIVPWARLTSAFPLIPLGTDSGETLIRIVRVFIRQVVVILYWLLMVFVGMTLAGLIIPALPVGVGELVFLLLALALGGALLVLASFLHTIIIAESCFGKLTVPAMIKATRLMVVPLAGSLLVLAITMLIIMTIVNGMLAVILPEGIDLTARLVISGALNFMVSAIHIAAINRLAIWLKAASNKDTGSGD